MESEDFVITLLERIAKEIPDREDKRDIESCLREMKRLMFTYGYVSRKEWRDVADDLWKAVEEFEPQLGSKWNDYYLTYSLRDIGYVLAKTKEDMSKNNQLPTEG